MAGTALSSLRNIGPATEAAFVRAGVPDAETLRALGADAAYARLLAGGERAHFIAYYVLVMALQGRPWNDAKGDEKIALRARFDALCAAHAASSHEKGRPKALEAALNILGVVPVARRQPTSSRPEKK